MNGLRASNDNYPVTPPTIRQAGAANPLVPAAPVTHGVQRFTPYIPP